MDTHADLMNLYWTTSGIFPGFGEISRFEFKDRVEAASRAGFKGIGIWHTDLEHTLQQRSLEEMKMILDDNGMEYIELEFLTDRFLTGARKAESDSRRRRLFEASEALRAMHVKIGDFYNSVCPMSQIIDAFGALCQEAEGYGATIGFEFMASAMIDNLSDSLAMVEAANASNGGVVLDIAHVAQMGISYDEISRMPLRFLVNVELNDGALPRSPMYDPSRARRFCGEGDFDIRGFIQCIYGIGYTGPWAVEVFSEELARCSLAELNTRSFETTIAQFA